jgi:hypothetical protein
MVIPFVSVLVDTYNHERFIEEALSSVLAQDYPAASREIIVLDDGSTDRTPEILRKFESHVRILRKTNGGQASAFNLGIPQCKGKIVAFLDGDDWWAPGKLRAVMTAFAENPNVGLIGHGITEVLAEGIQRAELVRESPQFRIDSPLGARLFRKRKSFLGTSRMACRSEILHRIGPVPETLIFEADEYIFTLAAIFADVLILRPPLTFYRIQGQNLFQLSGAAIVQGARRKWEVLTALANALRERFSRDGLPLEVAQVIIESIQNEADVLRLSLENRMPWETVAVELQSFQFAHEQASVAHWLMKCVSLLPALFLSSRRYEAMKSRFARNSMYRKTREKILPMLRPLHVDRTGQWDAK